MVKPVTDGPFKLSTPFNVSRQQTPAHQTGRTGQPGVGALAVTMIRQTLQQDKPTAAPSSTFPPQPPSQQDKHALPAGSEVHGGAGADDDGSVVMTACLPFLSGHCNLKRERGQWRPWQRLNREAATCVQVAAISDKTSLLVQIKVTDCYQTCHFTTKEDFES